MAAKGTKKGKKQKGKFHDFIMSDQSRINRYGYRVLVSGIKILDFTIALDSHDADKRSIGRWENIRVEGDRLLGRLYYNMNNPRAVEIYEDVESGNQNGVSMGLIPNKGGWSSAPEHLLNGQESPTLVKCEMYECSPTNIPADAGAVRLYADNQGKVLQLSAVPILNSKPPTVMNKQLKQLLALYALRASTDAEALTLLTKAKTDADAKIAAQQTSLSAMRGQMEDLVLAANKDVLKTDNQKSFFKTMYAQDANMALEYVKTLEAETGDTPPADTDANAPQGLPDVAMILAALQGGADVGGEKDEKANWTYLEWFKNDSKGLEEMETANPDKFSKLVDDFKKSSET